MTEKEHKVKSAELSLAESEAKLGTALAKQDAGVKRLTAEMKIGIAELDEAVQISKINVLRSREWLTLAKAELERGFEQ